FVGGTAKHRLEVRSEGEVPQCERQHLLIGRGLCRFGALDVPLEPDPSIRCANTHNVRVTA
ncbi:MAG: hypothetical protein ACJA00_003355, partial [Myxococcota bacterium]